MCSILVTPRVLSRSRAALASLAAAAIAVTGVGVAAPAAAAEPLPALIVTEVMQDNAALLYDIPLPTA